MSQKFCSVQKGRIMELSLEPWALLNQLDDEDKLDDNQKREFDGMWEYINGYVDVG